jgi:hypothetical protein
MVAIRDGKGRLKLPKGKLTYKKILAMDLSARKRGDDAAISFWESQRCIFLTKMIRARAKKRR